MRQTCELLDAWLMGGCNSLFIIWKSISFWLCRRKSQRQSTWCLTDGVRPQLWRSSWGKAATLNKRLSGRSGFCRLGDILRETLRLGSCVKPKRHRSKQIQLGSRLGVIHGVRFPKWGKENMETTLFYFYLVCFSGSSLVLAIPQSSADPKVVHNLMNWPNHQLTIVNLLLPGVGDFKG